MWFAKEEAEEGAKAEEIPSSEPALPTRQRWRELLSDFLKNEEAAINIVIILLVLVDVSAALTFEAFIDVSCRTPRRNSVLFLRLHLHPPFRRKKQRTALVATHWNRL